MHELMCPSCNAPSQYNLRDYIFMCPFCSTSFRFDPDTGKKPIFQEHFIVPNTTDARNIKENVVEWLKRLHHNANAANKEFTVLDVTGVSLPYWVISLEAHTSWKGLVKRQNRTAVGPNNSEHLMEAGNFQRSYRWCVSARKNLCEYWEMTRLHQPKEDMLIDWDGFPLDSTFSRGRLDDRTATRETADGGREDVPAYEIREYFDFKYANGLPILGIEVSEAEALERAKAHINRYHYNLAMLMSDINVFSRTELEIAGIQLIHLPFWHATYAYRPKSALRHLHQMKENHVILDGYGCGILAGEIAIRHQDKLKVNAIVFALSSVLTFVAGIIWHPAFIVVAVILLLISMVSAYVGFVKDRNAQIISRRSAPSAHQHDPMFEAS